MLKDYNHYNLIDYYCRWDTVLRRSFRFYDSVGDLCFFKNSLNCMKKSDIIVTMYNLNEEYNYAMDNIDKSIQFLQSFDEKLEKIFHRDDEVQSKYQYPTIIIEISNKDLTPQLKHQHKQTVLELSQNLTQLKVINMDINYNRAIYIDHCGPGEILRIADLVGLLYKIEKGKEKLKAGKLPAFPIDESKCCFRCAYTDFKSCGTQRTHKNKANTYDQLIVREVRERYTNTLKNNNDKRQIVYGPVCVHYTRFTQPKGKIFNRFLLCFAGGLIFFPLIITMQTCLFW